MSDVGHNGTGWSVVVAIHPAIKSAGSHRLSRWHSGPPRFASRGQFKPSRAPDSTCGQGPRQQIAPAGIETAEDSGQTTVGTDSDGNTYVIVPETHWSHQTFATAQGLPDDPYFGVIGTIGGGEPIDLYRLTVSAATAGFQFELVSSPSASTASPRFWLFDGSGRVMGEWPSSTGSSGSLITFALDNSFSGSSLFLGVSPGNPNGRQVRPCLLGYQLWVQRFSAPTDLATATGAGAILPSIASTLFVGALVVPLLTLTAAPSRGDSSAVSTPAPAPNDLTAGFRVSVGSMPTRSAQPAGGLMSEGEASSRRDLCLPGAGSRADGQGARGVGPGPPRGTRFIEQARLGQKLKGV